ncbi:hypothetical protein AB0F43_37190 [Kribbella sp. NPDC023972]
MTATCSKAVAYTPRAAVAGDHDPVRELQVAYDAGGGKYVTRLAVLNRS